jgi:hypothetical protein
MMQHFLLIIFFSWDRQRIQYILPVVAFSIMAIIMSLLQFSRFQSLWIASLPEVAHTSVQQQSSLILKESRHSAVNRLIFGWYSELEQFMARFDLYISIILLQNGYTVLVSSATDPFNCQNAGYDEYYISKDPSIKSGRKRKDAGYLT